MNTKRILVHCLTAALAALSWSGCATAPHVVEGPTNHLHGDRHRGFFLQADQMIQSLLGSGILDKSSRKPAVMVVGRIVNNTTRQLDTDLLTKISASPSTRAARRRPMSTVGFERPGLYSLRQNHRDRVRQGNIRQSTYTSSYPCPINGDGGLGEAEEITNSPNVPAPDSSPAVCRMTA